jgi:hypothetical protein
VAAGAKQNEEPSTIAWKHPSGDTQKQLRIEQPVRCDRHPFCQAKRSLLEPELKDHSAKSPATLRQLTDGVIVVQYYPE